MMKDEDNKRYKNKFHWGNGVGIEKEEVPRDKFRIVGWEHEVPWSLLRWLLKMIQEKNANNATVSRPHNSSRVTFSVQE